MPERPQLVSIPSGSITSPKGFFAGGVHAGIKNGDDKKLDLAALFSEAECTVAGVFTTNRVKSAPVRVSMERAKSAQHGRVLVVNGGCANACTGEQGVADAKLMAKLMSAPLGVSEDGAYVASTGVIGVPLPMDKVGDGLQRMALTREGGHDFAQAIMTTDTFAKETAFSVKGRDFEYTIAGAAKGSGMIHPNMATMLCFITTDARVERVFLGQALKRAVDMSFNMVTVDGDTSPSDTVLVFANGLSCETEIGMRSPEAKGFQSALDRICFELAHSIARDGEGATRVIEVTVEGARSTREARLAAKTIAGSSLVKSAVHGADPNWGRVVAALGRSGAALEEARLDVRLGDVQVMGQGKPLAFDAEAARRAFKEKEVLIRVSLNLGRGVATALGCDLSAEYVRINSAYTS